MTDLLAFRLRSVAWTMMKQAIGRVEESHPDFLFLTEVYWGLERTL
ncbi:hypothetical protein ACFLV4_04425 [Chloroflexota bacterium]